MSTAWEMSNPGRTLIKICGLRDEEMLTAAVEAGADAVGAVQVMSRLA